MAVYVDSAENRFVRLKMCHMVADTPEELHAMADKIGVARRWYQFPPVASFPHYDICKAKRAMALRYGAQEIDRRQLSAHMRETRGAIIAAGKTWADTGWVTR